MGNNSVFQKVSIKAESTFGTGTGNLSAGYRLFPAEKIDLSAFEQQMHSGDQTLSGVTDLGPKAMKTFKVADFSTNHLLSGATRGALNVITSDKTSDFLVIVCGARETPLASADTVATAASGSSFTVTTGSGFAAGQLIMVNNQVRIIDTWTVGTKTITLKVPLSATPTGGDNVYPVESFTFSGAKSSAAIGIETESLAGWDVLAVGCICKKFGIATITNTEPVMMSADWSAQNWTLGSGLVTNAATDEIEAEAVICGNGGGLKYVNGSSALAGGFLQSSELTNPYEEAFVEDVGSTNGKGGHTMTPTDDPRAMIKAKFFAESATYSDLDTMVGTETQVIVQVGASLGGIVGYCMDKAFVKVAVKPAENERKYYCEVTFAGTNLRLFRA